MSDQETHPVQTPGYGSREKARISTRITLRAYEVYCHLFGPQEAMITGSCRGGFSAGELISFLYIHSFPKDEWKDRFAETFEGMKGL